LGIGKSIGDSLLPREGATANPDGLETVVAERGAEPAQDVVTLSDGHRL
jgi:hypothetical protein